MCVCWPSLNTVSVLSHLSSLATRSRYNVAPYQVIGFCICLAFIHAIHPSVWIPFMIWLVSGHQPPTFIDLRLVAIVSYAGVEYPPLYYLNVMTAECHDR